MPVIPQVFYLIMRAVGPYLMEHLIQFIAEEMQDKKVQAKVEEIIKKEKNK
jgi:methionine salvage enolase-phosphatase E1